MAKNLDDTIAGSERSTIAGWLLPDELKKHLSLKS